MKKSISYSSGVQNKGHHKKYVLRARVNIILFLLKKIRRKRIFESQISNFLQTLRWTGPKNWSSVTSTKKASDNRRQNFGKNDDCFFHHNNTPSQSHDLRTFWLLQPDFAIRYFFKFPKLKNPPKRKRFTTVLGINGNATAGLKVIPEGAIQAVARLNVLVPKCKTKWSPYILEFVPLFFNTWGVFRLKCF